MSAQKLLIVEDDPGMQAQFRWHFDRYEVLYAEDRESALAQLRRHEPMVVLQDLGLPPDPDGTSEGMATLSEILSAAPHTKVVVVTGNGDESSAVKAVGLGAYDFYEKPVEPDTLNLIVERAFHVAELERQNRELLRTQGTALDGFATGSQRMLKICRMVEKVANTNGNILLLGETGTGKEVLARALHSLSDRARGNFVAINCAAIPENLLESELFGYEKGAYTGAHRQTKGKLENADGGTVLLDEIGDMPMALQSKLLRFLQERVMERVGGRQSIPVDVRVICATHQNLGQLIKDNAFREDLYYRINDIEIAIPPLREREGDSVFLARMFLIQEAEKEGKDVRGFTDDAINAIHGYQWPGNVRELQKAIRRAVILTDGKLIDSADLSLAEPDGGVGTLPPLNLRQVRHEAEQRALETAMTHANGNVSKASELLGVSRPTLYDLMRKHGVKAGADT
ncbi:PEP-CTERM-box response regulator transcription factor [Aquisalimonas lutea]|uniref:PEP-CTERM-box response regulator transcription factor n=1 Tax=Aquisalimonas lutea TaxID=1327750 RepID=UPI0025B5F23E|nr:PEP-CTERM-box response regulator transcription factor [Aquisalimonas lutea]MDN3517172.1 PEP-CTERM-box response regulator transcription factor [Aquisalimonas lutea]